MGYARIVVLAAIAVALDARMVVTQTRDTQATASGVISGVLVAADTSVAVRNARVSLTSDGLSAPLLSITDDQGGFSFTNLAAGEYLLWAAKPGFVTAGYGESRPGSERAGKKIVLAERQRVERLKFAIPRAGVLTGQVLDEFGEPAQGAAVQARRYIMVSGRWTTAGGGIGDVDDRGIYRIASLSPGHYLVFVSTSGSRSQAFRAGDMARAEASANSPPSVLFSYRPEAGDSPQTDQATTYYPGTTAVSGASPIPLALGEERSGIDFRVQRVRLSRLSGTVRDVDGSIARGDVQLSESPGTTASMFGQGSVQSARLDDNGRFSFTRVTPGQYTLLARSRSTDDRVPSASRWALQELTASGANVDGLVLTLQGGVTVSGTVTTDVGSRPPFVGGVVFVPAGESRFLTEHVLMHAGVSESGRFTTELVPGRYRVEFRSTATNLRLISALFDGRDALDFPLEVKEGRTNVDGLLTLTSRDTELSGTVFGIADAPTRAFTVVVSATDDRYWVPDNRRNQSAIPDAQGRFTFANLPAGNYRLALVEDFDAVAGIHADLLRQIASTSTVLVTIADGERKVQDLRIK